MKQEVEMFDFETGERVYWCKKGMKTQAQQNSFYGLTEHRQHEKERAIADMMDTLEDYAFHSRRR